jgi:hypothetical protein
LCRALQGAWSAIANVNGSTGPEILRLGIEGAVAGGHDTDTVGAIPGGLLGAAYGATAVPWEWKERLHGSPDLRVRGLVGLSQLIVNGGRPTRLEVHEGPPIWTNMDNIRHVQSGLRAS